SRRGRPTRGGKFGGPRPTCDGRELRRRRRHPRPAGKLDPLRAAALTALPASDRARALPGLASDIDRLLAAVTEGDASRKRRVENMPAAPKASLPALLAAYAAVCQRRRILRDRRGPAR